MDTNAVILRALEQVSPNAYVTIDHLRDATTAAQLSSAEKSGGLRAACKSGHLRPVYHLLPGFSLDPVHVSVPSTHPAAKGRMVLVYRRTRKRVAA